MIDRELHIPLWSKFQVALPLLSIINLPALGSWVRLVTNYSSIDRLAIVSLALSFISIFMFALWVFQWDWKVEQGIVKKRYALGILHFSVNDVVGVGEAGPFLYGTNVFELVLLGLNIATMREKMPYVEFRNGKKVSLYCTEQFIGELKCLVEIDSGNR